ncbi:MAG: F420-nonreducing hydrogenase [Candidatus Bathyarchaeota archaeon]|nr:F420-nonreducing hydrogenase [Candidatus Bathyarchaeota archaeon]
MARILLTGLTGDMGCQVAALSLHEELVDIFVANELVYAPTLLDIKNIPDDIDLAFIEGGVRSTHDEEILKEIRAKSKYLIAFGACATYGGVPGLANLSDGEELLNEIYGNQRGTDKGTIPTHLKVLPEMHPLKHIVEVDFFIQGCPPEVTDIAGTMKSLLNGHTPQYNSTQVCDECPRKRTGEYEKNLKRIHEETLDPDRCLLEQGFICMGPATMGGCSAPCPQAGQTCDGCRGKCLEVDDQGLAMVDAMTGLLTQLNHEFDPDQYSGMLYRFSYAESRIAELARRHR